MARAPRKPAAKTPAKRGGTSVADIRKQMQAQAEAATDMEKNAALGRSFSFKQGQMTFDGNPVEGNRAIVIIADAIIEKGWYDGPYDPNNPEPPACYAFGYDPDEIAPKADDVADLQSDTCEECPLNVFGSADTGKGKACKDSRRLLLLPAGKYGKNDALDLEMRPEHYEKAEMATAKLPPTSLNAYASFVRQVAGTMGLPPHGIFAEMICEPDPNVQFKVWFEPIEEVPDELLGIIMQRHEQARDMIAQPYTYSADDEKPKPKRGGRKAPAKKPARGGRASSGSTRGKRKY